MLTGLHKTNATLAAAPPTAFSRMGSVPVTGRLTSTAPATAVAITAVRGRPSGPIEPLTLPAIATTAVRGRPSGPIEPLTLPAGLRIAFAAPSRTPNSFGLGILPVRSRPAPAQAAQTRVPDGVGSMVHGGLGSALMATTLKARRWKPSPHADPRRFVR